MWLFNADVSMESDEGGTGSGEQPFQRHPNAFFLTCALTQHIHL
jgi:hypothetical protein